jgi:hypothetical protein
MSVDAATWQALGLVLTLLGLVLSALVWSRRGAARGLRGVAWSLVPLAAGLTGVLRLGWEIGDSVVQWAGRLVFSPTVWLGLLVAVLSAVLFVVSGAMLRRRGPAKGPAKGAAPAASSPALPRKRSSQPAGSAGDDMADIEEILRKHGIQ